MRKKHLIPVLAAIIVLPFAVAHGDTSPSGADCGSRPTRPAVGAAADQMTQFRTQMQNYFKCMYPNGRPGGGMGGGWRNGGNANPQADKTQATQDRCTLINQRITDRINNFQSNQGNDKTIFGNLYDNLNNIQTRISNAGVDTTTLKSDLSTLQTDIAKVNTDYASFISNLQTVQSSSSTCGNSQSQFMANLTAARSILATLRTDRSTVRSYVTGTIIPEIKTLRQQLQSKEGTSSSTTSN